MTPRRCGLCGRSARSEGLISLRGLRGQVCRPGVGCDLDHPALASVRRWLMGPDARRLYAELDDIYVDNPQPGQRGRTS